jgi:hypothetical protein
MDNRLANFIRVKHIDSFQKLRFLLFLYQHPDENETARAFAERLYLGDVPLLEEIIIDLQKAGLVDCVADHCTLHDESDVRFCLGCLTRVFEDPLARQKLLDQVGNNPSRVHYQESVYEYH